MLPADTGGGGSFPNLPERALVGDASHSQPGELPEVRAWQRAQGPLGQNRGCHCFRDNLQEVN